MLDGKGKFLAGVFVVVLCFAITAALFFFKTDIPTQVADILKISLGVLLGFGAQIVGYYWGGADPKKDQEGK